MPEIPEYMRCNRCVWYEPIALGDACFYEDGHGECSSNYSTPKYRLSTSCEADGSCGMFASSWPKENKDA